MRHASQATLDQIDELLEAVRLRASLVERKRGIFYRTSKSFLHFHEDPAGIFADLRLGADFERFDVTNRESHAAFLDALDGRLEPLSHVS